MTKGKILDADNPRKLSGSAGARGVSAWPSGKKPLLAAPPLDGMLAARRSSSPPVSNSAFAATQLEWEETRLPRPQSGARRFLAWRRKLAAGVRLRGGRGTVAIGTGRPVVAFEPICPTGASDSFDICLPRPNLAAGARFAPPPDG